MEIGQGSFASSFAARWLRETPDERHRVVHGTLVSADLSGFTAMSERLASRGREGSERLTSTINSCFTVLIDGAGREGGDVLKFGGDALLLWFDGAGHEERAVRACVRMQRSIGATRFARAGLRMSVGGHTGAFDLFLVGRSDWRELVVVGRAVSHAVELEAAASAGEILISSELAAAVPSSWCGVTRAGGVLVVPEAVHLPRRSSAAGEDAGHPALLAPGLQADVAALASTGGEHRMATIVFAELEGTDTSLVTLPIEEFVASVDALVNAAQAASDRFGVQFLYTDVIADGIKLICTAGAPTTSTDDEEAGLRFATELVPNDPKHKLRAGVHCGRVFAGFLGSPTRRTYTVMGDPVNLAARLMGKAEPGQVIASSTLLSRIRAEFEVAELPPFLVKGKEEPILAAVVGPPTGTYRVRDTAALPLVGREVELAQLRGAITEAVDGRGQVVELVGDAGIGKTRLLEAVGDDARIEVRVGTECQPYDALAPYASVRPLLRRALGIGVDTTPGDAGEALAAVVTRCAPGLRPLLPLLAVPVGAQVPATPEAAAVAEEFRAERTHRATVELLGAVLTRATMLVVEDVYYVDDASLRLLQVLASDVPSHPWLLTVTRRPEGPGLVVGPVAGTLVKLQPLDPAVVARLAEVALGERMVAGPEVELLARRSGGNPLFVLQLVDAAGEGVSADELPESIERLVAARVDRLDPHDRALLRRAAVIGRVFPSEVLDALLALDGEPPVVPGRWQALADLVEADGPRTWRFRHALFRDVAYEGLPFARRRRMHGAVGELLEQGVAGDPDVALLSQHFWLAGDPARTWRYSVAAGEAAWATAAVAEAIAAFRRALSVRRQLGGVGRDEVAAVAESLGDVLERAARYDEAEQAYASARRTACSGPVVGARLRRKLGTIAERTGRYRLALRRYSAVVAQLDPADPAHAVELARAELARGTVRHRQGFHHELVACAERARDHADRAGDRWVSAAADNAIQVAITHGAGLPGTTHGERALAGFRSLGDELYVGKVLNNLGIEAYYRGRWTEAAQRYEEAHQAFARAGDLAEAASALQNLGEIRCDQGRWDEAESMLRQAHRDWSAAGFGIGVPLTELNLGRTLARAGRLADGAAAIARARDAFDAMGAHSFARDAASWEAEVHLLAGDHAAAIERLDALDVLADVGEAFPATDARALRIRGWASLQDGRFEDALNVLADAVMRCRAAELAFEELLALEGLVVAGEGIGDDRVPNWRREADRLRQLLAVVALPVLATA